MDNKDEAAQFERRIADLRSGIQTDLDAAKREILKRLHEIESSVELVARELARRAGNDNGD